MSLPPAQLGVALRARGDALIHLDPLLQDRNAVADATAQLGIRGPLPVRRALASQLLLSFKKAAASSGVSRSLG